MTFSPFVSLIFEGKNLILQLVEQTPGNCLVANIDLKYLNCFGIFNLLVFIIFLPDSNYWCNYCLVHNYLNKNLLNCSSLAAMGKNGNQWSMASRRMGKCEM